jgi:hypothetical protein
MFISSCIRLHYCRVPKTLMVFNVTSRWIQECKKVPSRNRGRSHKLRCSPQEYKMRSETPVEVSRINPITQCLFSETSGRYGTQDLTEYMDLNNTRSFMAIWSFFIPIESCFKLCLRSSVAVTDKLYLKTDRWVDPLTSQSGKQNWSEYNRVAVNNSYISMVYVYNPLMRKIHRQPFFQFTVTRAPTDCSCFKKSLQIEDECKYLYGM